MTAPRKYKFADFILDETEEILLNNGHPLGLKRREFQVLHLLVANAGNIVRKEDFFEKIWNGAFVEDNNLTVTIAHIRKTLDEAGSETKLIETVSRKGYRFTGNVEIIDAEKEEKENKKSAVSFAKIDEAEKTEKPKPPAKRGFPLYVLTGLILLLVAGAFGYFYLTKPSNIKTQRKLAVLPFKNLQPAPETDFLGYALADTMIAKLAPIKILGVRPSQSIAGYVEQPPTREQIVNELKADLILTGTYQKIGDRLEIKTELVDIPGNDILYSDNFSVEYEQLSTLQERLARRIISELGLNVSNAENELLRLAEPNNEKAYELYLKGIDHYNAARFPQAIEMLEKSLALDPNFPRAWEYLGTSFMVNASTRFGGHADYAKAQAALEKAIALDPSSQRPRILLTDMLIETNRAEEAVRILRDYLKENPENALAHWELSYAYRYGGLLEKSREEGEAAYRADPGFTPQTAVPIYYLYLGEYEKFKDSIPVREDSAYFLFYKGFAEYHLGNHAASMEYFDAAFETDKKSLQARIGKAFSYKIAGNTAEGLQLLHQIEKDFGQKIYDPEGLYKLAQAFAVYEDKKSALRVLKNCLENGFFSYEYIINDPLTENLRKEPQFIEALEKIRPRYEKFKTL